MITITELLSKGWALLRLNDLRLLCHLANSVCMQLGASQSMALRLLLSKIVAVFVEFSGWHEEAMLAISSSYRRYVNDNVLSMKPLVFFLTQS